MPNNAAYHYQNLGKHAKTCQTTCFDCPTPKLQPAELAQRNTKKSYRGNESREIKVGTWRKKKNKLNIKMNCWKNINLNLPCLQ